MSGNRRRSSRRLATIWVALVIGALYAVPASAATTSAGAVGRGSTASTALPPAPVWSNPPFLPHRPAACPPAPADPNTASPGQVGTTTGTVPWPPTAAGSRTNPELAAATDHTPRQFPPLRPANWSNGGGNLMLTSARSNKPALANNPQELCGVRGNSVDTAWQVTTGSPKTVIAVTDSGIEWCDPGLVNKIYLNKAALPPPEDAAGKTKSQLERAGQHFADRDPYDLNGSGIVNVAQYANDPRVAAVARAYGGVFCATHKSGAANGYTGISPEDLIRAFGRATMPGPGGRQVPNPYYRARQGPAGFTNAIAGWNFVNNNNNPYDAVHYDHGTGEAEDSSAAAGALATEVGSCPNCMVLPIRVGDSFIATANTFAEGVLFGVDSGASIVQEALGTLNDTTTAQQAIDYARAHGVPVVASAADEESQHQNEPANLAHTIVVNSVWRKSSFNPPSYLNLNGCTNYGGNIAVSVESASCSSEATGKSSGIVGLAESAAATAMAEGKIRPYPGLRSATGKPVALSANEIRQLVTMSASDVNFATAAPPFPANNYAVTTPYPGTTTRYPTKRGFDIYTGYGRIDAQRLVNWIANGDIPPQASFTGLPWFQTLSPHQTLSIDGLVGTSRAKSFRWQLDVAPGVQPSQSSWRLLSTGRGHGSEHRALASVPLRQVAQLFPGGLAALTGGPVGAGGQPLPNKFTFTLRLVVQASNGLIGKARRTEYLHQSSSLLPGYPKRLGSSIVAAPTLAPIGPHGENVLLVATAGGTVHAYLPDGKELAGWPVHTAIDTGFHPGEAAYSKGAVRAIPHGEIIDVNGGVAVGDLSNAGGHHPDVVVTDNTGRVYAWNAHGQLLPGFPVRTSAAFSGPGVANHANRVLRGIASAAALAPLQGTVIERGPGHSVRRVQPLDIVAAGMDRHVYAWQPNGQPVPGWPVLVINPAKVASINPTSNQVTFTSSANPAQGTKLIDTPAIGRLQGGSGPPDVVVGSNEEYYGPANAQLGSLGSVLSALGGSTGNGEVYAIHAQGSLHAAPAGSTAPPGDPNPGAFLPGWPASIADISPGLLPDVGDGVTNSPALAHLTGNSTLDVAAMAAIGPLTLLNPSGTSLLGSSGGLPIVAATSPPGAGSNTGSGLLATTIPALGGPSFGAVGPVPGPVSAVAPAISLGALLDTQLPAQQKPNTKQVDAWNATTGQLDSGFPSAMNDLQFFNQPIVADVGGATQGAYVVEASGLNDLRAVNTAGQEAPGFPKFTGGWTMNSPALGRFGRLPNQAIVAGNREGELFAWKTPTPACAPSGPWPMAHHDLSNSNNLSTPQLPGGPACPPTGHGSPTTAVGLPRPGSTVAGTIWLDASAKSSAGIASLHYVLSGGTLAHPETIATATSTIDGWLAGWASYEVPNGTYSITSVATASGGKSATSAPVTITVDNSPLRTSVLVPAASATVSGSSVLLDAGATGRSKITSVTFELSSGSSAPTEIARAVATPFGWVARWNSHRVRNGTYTLESVAVDANRNTDTSSGISVVVDNAHPVHAAHAHPGA
ncbi:MAG: hypothetical protein ACYCVN_12095 [Acidimicrobiales bacterium]